MAFLRFEANPEDAKGAVTPAATPKARETKAIPIRMSPYFVISDIFPP